jgi:hypothetical protein
MWFYKRFLEGVFLNLLTLKPRKKDIFEEIIRQGFVSIFED